VNNKKFRVWDKLEKRFIYPDKGYQGHYILSLDGKFHNLQNGSGGDECEVQQFLGILDSNMKEIFEGDVVKGVYGLEGLEIIGEVTYSCDLCAYVVDWHHEISNIQLDTLEVLGNLKEDYIYDESGILVKK
jgi:uncharacterized phage protein (TIGR01671 family)